MSSNLVRQLEKFGVKSVDVTDLNGVTHACKLDDIEEVGNTCVVMEGGKTINGKVVLKGKPGRVQDFLIKNAQLEMEIQAQTIHSAAILSPIKEFIFSCGGKNIALVHSPNAIMACRLIGASGLTEGISTSELAYIEGDEVKNGVIGVTEL